MWRTSKGIQKKNFANSSEDLLNKFFATDKERIFLNFTCQNWDVFYIGGIINIGQYVIIMVKRLAHGNEETILRLQKPIFIAAF
jgi:hypothetical protein